MLGQLSLFFGLLLIAFVRGQKCPDGQNAFNQCNQETQTCEEDFDLQCAKIQGIYYCCNPGPGGGEQSGEGAAGEAPCVDKSNNCGSIGPKECNSQFLQPTMRQNCARTCGFCTGPLPPSTTPAVSETSTAAAGSSSPPPTSSPAASSQPPTSSAAPPSTPEVTTNAPQTTSAAQTTLAVPSTIESTPAPSTAAATSQATSPPTTESAHSTTEAADDGECKDKNPNCDKNDCGLESIKDMLQEECKKTCGFCGASTTVVSTTHEQTTSTPQTTSAAQTTSAPQTTSAAQTTSAPQTTVHSTPEATTEAAATSEAPNGECKDHNPECPSLKNYCTDPDKQTSDLAHNQCPATCGTCGSTAAASTVVSTTPEHTTSPPQTTTNPQTTSAAHTTSAPQTTTHEASTTHPASSTQHPTTHLTTEGTTHPPTTHAATTQPPNGDCQDENPRCNTPEYKAMCKDPLATIRDLMKVQCKRTCGFCDQTEAPTTTTTTTKRPTKRTTKRPTTKRTTRPRRTTKRPTRRTPRPTRRTTTRRPPTIAPVCRNKMQQCDMWNRSGFCRSQKILAVKKRTLCARTCGYCRG